MENKGKALKDILFFSVSTWVNFILGFVSTFILTRVFLPDVLGTINLFYATVTSLLSVVCLGLDASFIRFYHERPQNNSVADLLFNLVAICLFFSISLALIFGVCFQERVTDFFLGSKSFSLYLCIVFGLLSQVVLRFLNFSFRMKMDIKSYNIQNILINIVTRLSVIIGAFINSSSAKTAICANVLCMVFFTITYVIKQKKEWLPEDINFNYTGYKGLITFGLYGTLSVVILHAYTLSSQLIIKSELSTAAVGIYASAAFFSSILAALKGGFATYWSAYMYSNYQDKDKKNFICEMHDYILLSLLLFLIVLLPLRSILYLFIGAEYRLSKEFFTLVLLYPLLQTIQETTGYGIPIAKKNYITTIISVISFGLNVIIGLILVRSCGLLGVAFANSIAAVFSYIMTTLISQKFYNSIGSILKSWIGFCLVILLTYSAPIIKDDLQLSCVSLFVLVITLVLYKKNVKSIINLIKIKM